MSSGYNVLVIICMYILFIGVMFFLSEDVPGEDVPASWKYDGFCESMGYDKYLHSVSNQITCTKEVMYKGIAVDTEYKSYSMREYADWRFT